MPAAAPAPDPVALTPAMHHILLALLQGERHGYAIMQAIESITDGAMRLGPGTLYTSIRKLLDESDDLTAIKASATRAKGTKRRPPPSAEARTRSERVFLHVLRMTGPALGVEVGAGVPQEDNLSRKITPIP